MSYSVTLISRKVRFRVTDGKTVFYVEGEIEEPGILTKEEIISSSTFTRSKAEEIKNAVHEALENCEVGP